MRIYLALGDSISIDDYTGVHGGGAPSQLARKLGVELVDLTRDGNTTQGALADLAAAPATADVVTGSRRPPGGESEAAAAKCGLGAEQPDVVEAGRPRRPADEEHARLGRARKRRQHGQPLKLHELDLEREPVMELTADAGEIKIVPCGGQPRLRGPAPPRQPRRSATACAPPSPRPSILSGCSKRSTASRTHSYWRPCAASSSLNVALLSSAEVRGARRRRPLMALPRRPIGRLAGVREQR